ncbi:MAG: glycosyltransferase family 10 [Pseudomonadota bacterium]
MSVLDIWIDCYGRWYEPEFNALVGDTRYHFVFDPKRKRSIAFSLGLYLDEAVLSRDVRRYPMHRRFAVMLESPLHLDRIERQIDLPKQFAAIFTHRRSHYMQGAPWHCLHFGTSWLDGQWDRRYDKTELVSFVGSIVHPDAHGYGLRRQVVEACQARGDVQCFGKGIRPVASKIEGLESFAFSIAMENVQEDDYFTEKLIDCFLTETIPIYWGCSRISEIFDPMGIMTFADVRELIAILENLGHGDYDARREAITRNKTLALEQHLTSNIGIYKRIAWKLQNVALPVSPLNPAMVMLRRSLARLPA